VFGATREGECDRDAIVVFLLCDLRGLCV